MNKLMFFVHLLFVPLLFIPIALFRRFVKRPKFNRDEFDPGIPNDPKTIVIPMSSDVQGKSYYDVANDWSAEKMKAKRLILQAIDDARQGIDPARFPIADRCDLGIWLRFVDVPPEKASMLNDLRMWHEVWHNATESIFSELNQGRLSAAKDAVNSRNAGPWRYAARKVDALLAQLWTT